MLSWENTPAPKYKNKLKNTKHTKMVELLRAGVKIRPRAPWSDNTSVVKAAQSPDWTLWN